MRDSTVQYVTTLRMTATESNTSERPSVVLSVRMAKKRSGLVDIRRLTGTLIDVIRVCGYIMLLLGVLIFLVWVVMEVL